MKTVKDANPFAILARVVLPENLHAIWRLPPSDADYPLRWSFIKAGFSRRLAKNEHIRASRQAKREPGVWQRRYCEHQIRDGIDLARHVDYIHYNPLKHGWVTRPANCTHSTLHGYIKRGMAASNWGGKVSDEVDGYGER
jgi:putative transposase